MALSWQPEHPVARLILAVGAMFGPLGGGGGVKGDQDAAVATLDQLDGGELFVGVAHSARMAMSLYDAHVDWAFGIEDLELDHGRDAVLRLHGVALAMAQAFGDGERAAEHPVGRLLLRWLATVELALAFSTAEEPVEEGFVAELVERHAEELQEDLDDLSSDWTAAKALLSDWVPRLDALVQELQPKLEDAAEIVREVFPVTEEADQDSLAAEIEEKPVYALLAGRLADGVDAGGAAEVQEALLAQLAEARQALGATRTRLGERQRKQVAVRSLLAEVIGNRAGLDRKRAKGGKGPEAGSARAEVEGLEAARQRASEAQKAWQGGVRTLTKLEAEEEELQAPIDVAGAEAAVEALREEAEAARSRKAAARERLDAVLHGLSALRLQLAEQLGGARLRELQEAREALSRVRRERYAVDERANRCATELLGILDEVAAQRKELRQAARGAPVSWDPEPLREVQARLVAARKERDALQGDVDEGRSRIEALLGAGLGEGAPDNEAAVDALRAEIDQLRATLKEARQESRILRMSQAAAQSGLEAMERDLVGVRERALEERAEQEAQAVEVARQRDRALVDLKEFRKRRQAAEELALAGRAALAEAAEAASAAGTRLIDSAGAGDEARARLGVVRARLGVLPRELERNRDRLHQATRRRLEGVSAGAQARSQLAGVRTPEREAGAAFRQAERVLERAQRAAGEARERRDALRERVLTLEGELAVAAGSTESARSALVSARSLSASQAQEAHAAAVASLEEARARRGKVAQEQEAVSTELPEVLEQLEAARARGKELVRRREELAGQRAAHGAAGDPGVARSRGEAAGKALTGAQAALKAGLAASEALAMELELTVAAAELATTEAEEARAAASRTRTAAEAARRSLVTVRVSAREQAAAFETARVSWESRREQAVRELQDARKARHAAVARIAELRPLVVACRTALADLPDTAGPAEEQGRRQTTLEGGRSWLEEIVARIELIAGKRAVAQERAEAARAQLSTLDAGAADAYAALEDARAAIRSGEEAVQKADLERAAAVRARDGAERNLVRRQRALKRTNEGLAVVGERLAALAPVDEAEEVTDPGTLGTVDTASRPVAAVPAPKAGAPPVAPPAATASTEGPRVSPRHSPPRTVKRGEAAMPFLGVGSAPAVPLADAATRIIRRDAADGPKVEIRASAPPRPPLPAGGGSVNDLLARIKASKSGPKPAEPDEAEVDLSAATMMLSADELRKQRLALLAEADERSKDPKPAIDPSLAAARTMIFDRDRLIAELDGMEEDEEESS